MQETNAHLPEVGPVVLRCELQRLAQRGIDLHKEIPVSLEMVPARGGCDSVLFERLGSNCFSGWGVTRGYEGRGGVGPQSQSVGKELVEASKLKPRLGLPVAALRFEASLQHLLATREIPMCARQGGAGRSARRGWWDGGIWEKERANNGWWCCYVSART